jgi:hypothetical protein
MVINKLGIMPELATISWKQYPDERQYESALSYLEIVSSPNKASEIVDRLIDNSEIHYWHSGDILRAAGLFPPVVPNGDFYQVIRDINSNVSLNPPLIVQSLKQQRIHIASGYEVIAAVHMHNTRATIPCHVTAWDLA